LGDYPLRLLNQGQQDVLSVDLIVTVALDYLSSPLSGFLRPLSKSVKAHHSYILLSKTITNDLWSDYNPCIQAIPLSARKKYI
jgi:hypothetical protein